LEEDDSDSGIYELEVFGDSKTNITATLTYFNEYHEEFILVQEFELDPANSQVKQEGTNYTFIGLIVVLAVIAYILYRRWKKRKDSEEE
jgi:LPXTG-motif cell wall-anchored protein